MTQNKEELIAQLKNQHNADLQWQASIALAELPHAKGDQTIVDALVDALEPSNNYALTRAHAAESLGLLGDKRASSKLIESLKDHYRLTRAYAARALGKLKDESAIPSLINCLESDSYFGARAEAAEALGSICKENTSDNCEKVRIVLEKTKDREKNKEDPRAKRVLREGIVAFSKIDEAIKDFEKELDHLINEAYDELNDAEQKGDQERQKRVRQALDFLNKFKGTGNSLRGKFDSATRSFSSGIGEGFSLGTPTGQYGM